MRIWPIKATGSGHIGLDWSEKLQLQDRQFRDSSHVWLPECIVQLPALSGHWKSQRASHLPSILGLGYWLMSATGTRLHKCHLLVWKNDLANNVQHHPGQLQGGHLDVLQQVLVGTGESFSCEFVPSVVSVFGTTCVCRGYELLAKTRWICAVLWQSGLFC